MESYEITLLLHPDLEIDLEAPLKKIEKIIKDNGGKIEASDNWGKRKLAYPIKGQEFAVYQFYVADLPPTSIEKLDKAFVLSDEVIRHLIVRKVEYVEEEEQKEEAKEEKTK